MKPVTLAVLCSILAVAGCGDNNQSDTAMNEQSPPPAQDQQAMDDTAGSITAPDTSADAADPGAAAPDTAPAGDIAAESSTDMGQSATNTAPDATAPDSNADMAAGTGTDTTADPAAGAAAVAPAAGGEAGAAQADMAVGQSVYEGKCKACHATGAAGAPKLDDKANWAPRIAQGMDTLNKHAIEGFKGTVGFMPPKGGFATLSDDEVKAAVAYMVSQAQ